MEARTIPATKELTVMKQMRIKLTTAIAVTLLLSGLDAKVQGYPTGYGPFPAGREPAAIPLNKCELEGDDKAQSDDIDGAVRQYRLQAAVKGQKQITLALRGKTNGWAVDVCNAQGKSLMIVPFTNSMTSSQMEVFSCELNQDGLPDFIVNVWSGGTGLAMSGSEVTFLLSSTNGYRATSFYLYSFGKEDLVRFKAQGPVYFIFNDLIGSDGEKTHDGRDHNFWVYELNRIDGNRFIPADADQPGFPKWVWFTNKDNHEETTQLSHEQKARLLMKRNASR
jgi:hypothetical protein